MGDEKRIENKRESQKPADKSVEIKSGPVKPAEVDNGAGDKGAAQAVAKSVYGEKSKERRMARKDRGRRPERKDEFEQRVLDLARVTRVMAGGKRMSFRATVAIGDKKGKVSIALGKGSDVTIAITKAVNKAKKNMITVSTVNDTISHEIFQKYGAAKVLFKPAKKGKGVIAGGVVRTILELAGIHNVTSKILGTSNKVSNAKCTIEALRNLKKVEVKNSKVGDKKKGEEKSKISKTSQPSVDHLKGDNK